MIVPYQPNWQNEFLSLQQALHQTLDNLALRIDHIGSTSVPGLAAKDIIDIQITVESLDAAVEAALNQAGYQRVAHLTQDHLPPGRNDSSDDWIQWVFKPIASQRPVNVHVRLVGRANQRYALLFRDYLRANPAIAQAYAEVKLALAKYHPDRC
ncbi:MAG: GrpB family protein [Leptolyngbyaceae cyanobacterium CSU_1_3]|nr:GrpB family protein [Leptolyngbyaceae cyanobacterium CSU_1_3]